MKHCTFAMALAALVLAAAEMPAAARRGSEEFPGTPSARRAEKVARKARAHAEEGRYVEAIEEYEEAFRAEPTSTLLLELANTHRLAGNCEAAHRYYERYLERDPWVKNRRTLELRAKQMQTCAEGMPPPGFLSEDEEEEEALQASTEVTKIIPTAPMVDSPNPGRTTRVIGTTAAALGVSLLAGAIYYHVEEHNARARVDDLLTAGGMWSSHHDELEREARRAHDMKNVLYMIGGLSTVGGSVLYYLGWREGQARVTLVPIAGGGSIHVKF